ncbi:Core-2/I-Branching enzyme [Cooperia oncophora]
MNAARTRVAASLSAKPQAGVPPRNNLYSCNITEPLALSALERAKTESCIRKITDAACRLKNGAFHDQFPESQCGNHDRSLVNRRVGCFEDYKNNRSLNGFSYEFKSDNSPEKCRSFCYRAGFVYYGPHSMPKAVFETGSDDNLKRPRILFLLQLNGRNERQVKRLLKALYSPFHYYYIHVDKRQLYMLTEMKAVAAWLKLSNVFVSPDAHSTIWGGASLLTMVQGKSYMSSHGYNTGRFIQKQGFDFVFVECENRMWRIGRRGEFPRNLRVDGGSDWIVLHREFAEYSISDDELPAKLRALFASIILPVESFFHTLSYNSRFCESILGSNLRLTNWNRKQGEALL